MRFFSRVSFEVDSDRMFRLACDIQLQLLAARRKVLFGNQSAVGRKSRLPTCWLAQVNERLSTYNLCIDYDQLPPCARLK
jgi:5-formaminoimidazole-4-carboxamide-1-beta-D-ribofuranosyl 5'-monophosphate synthetase